MQMLKLKNRLQRKDNLLLVLYIIWISLIYFTIILFSILKYYTKCQRAKNFKEEGDQDEKEE